MKKLLILSSLLLLPFSGFSQSLRESVLMADYIVLGYWESKTIENDLDYYTTRDSIVIREVLKGRYSSPSILFDASTILDEAKIELERSAHLYFIKKKGNSTYLFNDLPIELMNQVKEMLKIDEIKKPNKRFLATVEWTIGILEKSTPLEYIDYNDLNEYSSFYKFYKNKGLINSLDSVLTLQQKERVVKRLCELKEWGRPECYFASLIYKDYPIEIEQHILKLTTEYFKNVEYPNTYDIKDFLEILLKGQKGKSVEPLIDKIENRDYEIKLIQEVIDELGKVLKTN
jgi:hypothetical protein